MMRSLYSGVAGLQNHQTRMDVVGNNVANVNTIGFKKNRVNFQDMLYQDSQGASRPTDDLGGTNPKQVGLGMLVAAIDTIHTQGAMQSTGVKSDLAIQGDGFFILRQGDQSFYTRAGAFGTDADGILVNPANGMRVQGWQSQEINGQMVVNPTGNPGEIRIPIYQKDPASATSVVKLMSNLDKNMPLIPEGATEADIARGTWTVSQNVYDSFGNTHQLRVEYRRMVDENGEAVPNQWMGEVFINRPVGADGEEANPTNLAVGVNGAEAGGTQFVMQFDNNGSLQSLTDVDGNVMDAGTLSLTVGFEVPESNEVDGEVLRQNFQIEVGMVGGYEDSTTQFASPSSNKSFFQDGYGMGYMSGYTIDQSGVITGVYTNGQSKVVGQIAMATFVNASGLEKSGETNFRETANSGVALIDVAGTAGKGKISAGMLEMSNVDLSAEFVDMIVTQRGFQANSKGITTSDTMLETILGLKR
ncbi:flagellar hook protein FlgE [Entomospira culicis]|uniref:Flagellar hook protein FlgE n=1 Tax=Entomospira culicis TaxID=2719989 RepID=A0A968KUM0_9SPIO|nr:flagellar hook protein FlgE [Entomospira culicis]NIZ19386.1 flagellar hook protein FlgE [Entomospira culicis]NIZ69709.1 flagellar hook protein FlgE [Entomospira culicis]WDI36819.1 flagellar hook protein FlgE [Entomospira culicis]WDI38448.1 flagellar hook protein FlgE [Entomospira culicis]